MKKLLGIVAVASVVAAANALTGRIYFDLTPAGGHADPDSQTHPGDTANTNPVANDGQTLYVYWEFGGVDQNVFSPNFNIEVDGPATIASAHYFNSPDPTGLGLGARWNTSQPDPDDGGTNIPDTWLAGNINQFGLKNNSAAQNFDTQYSDDPGTPNGSTLLGEISFDANGGTSEIFLRVNALGIAIEGGSPDDDIYFGYGDDPVKAGSTDRSAMADATVVPEPASMMLLGLGALALRRRR